MEGIGSEAGVEDLLFPVLHSRQHLICSHRKLISHFAKKVPAGIGGNKECCDNCKRGYRCITILVKIPLHGI